MDRWRWCCACRPRRDARAARRRSPRCRLLTALPWLADILLTDIFAGLAVLALYLLVLRPETLERWERVALFALIAFAAATHSATLAVLLALLWRRLARRAVRSAAWFRWPASAAASSRWCSALRCSFAANYVVAGPHRLDARRHRAPVRPHAAGRHRRALSRRPLSRSALAAVRPSRGAARPTPTCSSGATSVFDQLGRFEGLERRDAHDRARKPACVSVAADQGGARRHGRATRHGRAPVRREHRDLAHLRHDRDITRRHSARAMHAARQQKGELELHGDQPRACAGRVGIDDAAPRRDRGRGAGAGASPISAGSPPRPRSRSSPMRRSAARYRTRTTAMARAWSGSRLSCCSSCRGAPWAAARPIELEQSITYGLSEPPAADHRCVT